MSILLSAISILVQPNLPRIDQYANQRQDLAKYSFIRRLGIKPTDWKFSTKRTNIGKATLESIEAHSPTGVAQVTWTGSAHLLTYYSNREDDNPKSTNGGGTQPSRFGEPELHRKALSIAKEFGCDRLTLFEKGFNQFGMYSSYSCEMVDGILSTTGRSFNIDLNASTGEVEHVAMIPPVLYIRGKSLLGQHSAEVALAKYLKVHGKSIPTSYLGLRWTRVDQVVPDQVRRLHKVHLFKSSTKHDSTSFMVDAYTGVVSDRGWK